MHQTLKDIGSSSAVKSHTATIRSALASKRLAVENSGSPHNGLRANDFMDNDLIAAVVGQGIQQLKTNASQRATATVERSLEDLLFRMPKQQLQQKDNAIKVIHL